MEPTLAPPEDTALETHAGEEAGREPRDVHPAWIWLALVVAALAFLPFVLVMLGTLRVSVVVFAETLKLLRQLQQ